MEDLQQLLDERMEREDYVPLNKVNSSTIHRKETTVDIENDKLGVRNESAMGNNKQIKIAT